MFLIYVNELFTDNTSLFSVAHDVNTSASDISKDLKLISNWAFTDPDLSKQAQENVFSRKKLSYPTQVCILRIPQLGSVHKHLGMLPDNKLS